MKCLMFLVLSLAITMSACNKKNDDSGPGPVIVEPTPVPPLVCPEGQHEEAGVCVDDVVEDQCPEAAPGVYVCYDWGKCKGLFETFEEAAAIGLVMNETGCHKVDGEMTQHGFGPCSECHSIKPDGTVPYTIPFDEVLRQRAIMWLTK